MYKSSQNCFRKDLIVTLTTKKDTFAKSYLIKDPASGETFEFGEEEYFLCQAMNGTSTPSQILAAFKSRFDLSMTEEDFYQFSDQIANFGLLESLNKQAYSLSAIAEEENPQSPYEELLKEKMQDIEKAEEESQANGHNAKEKGGKRTKTFIWHLSNPIAFFAFIASIFRPFRILFKLSVWGLIPGLPLAFLTFFNNQSVFWRDMTSSVEPLPYLMIYTFNITLASLSAKLAQGIMLAYYGGRVEKFGLILAGGFLPRFYCDREGAWQLKRREQLWVFATPLVARLIFFVIGVLVWHWTHRTGTDLGTWALLLAHASFLDFLLDTCPLWPVDGFLFMLAYFRLPPNFLVRVYLVWDMVLNGRPLPNSFSFKDKLLLLLYGPAALLFTFTLIIFVAVSVANGLSSNFSGIFGRGTATIIITAMVLLAIRQPIAVLLKPKNRGNRTNSPIPSPPVQEYPRTRDSSPRQKKKSSWLKKLIIILLLAGICWLLIMPYPYRPGGQIQLLPPTQQQVQAPVDGKIIKVYFKGGDGKWIKSGTTIALMEATDIENDTLKTEQQIKSQQAILEKEQANLNKLLNTPRKEEVELAQKEIDVAKQQVEVAKQEIEVALQEVEVAKKQLDSAKSRFDFSSREADRYKFLANQGAVSQQAFEDKQKLADADSVKVEESQKNLLVKENEVQSKRSTLTTRESGVQEKESNLKLVLSGAHPDDIAAARKQVEAARAELKRLEQELKYNKDQLQRTELLMPIDGYLVTPYLDQKVGSYLDKGDTFAVTEDDRHIRGEVKVPEYNAGEFIVGAEVEVKLAAYPDVSFMGKVVSIEPTAASESSSPSTTGENTSSSTERIIRVIVDLPNVDKTLKAGLTGYAKIEGSDKPVIVAFTRPIVRYIQLEVWSWLP